MRRLLPYVGAFFGILLILFALSLGLRGAQTTSLNNITAPAAVATSSTTFSSAISTPPVATTTSTRTSVKPAPTKTKPVSTGSSAPQTTTITYNQSDFDTAAANLRNALVNIVCRADAGSQFESISGSGVLIDPKGIILTNAHVAQYFLFKDKGVSCVIRTGSPARDAYTASLIFISPSWVTANAKLLSEPVASGTGEYDFALLAITGSATNNPLSNTFASVPLALEAPYVPEPVVIGSYAAQFLTTDQILSSLFPTLVFGSVKELFTFTTNTPDIVSLGGSAAAQEGSSGGGVTDPYGNLVATITTSTVEGNTAARNVNAITAAYIRGDYLEETGNTLDSLLLESTSTAIANFAPETQELEAEILQNLK